MNEVFIIGKIASKVDFKFIINSKTKVAIAIYKIKIENTIIKIKAYNELADYSYFKLKENMEIMIEGELNSKMEVIVKEIEKI